MDFRCWLCLIFCSVLPGVSFVPAVEVGQPEPYLLPDGSPDFSWSDKPAFLGIFMREVDGKTAAALGIPGLAGVLVTDVMDNSPAMLGGFKAGDVILKMDKQEFQNMQMLRLAIMKRSPGEKVTFEVLRKGQIEELKVRLGEKKEE